MKIATFNINNVNRRLPNLLQWLKSARPDVVCLQELKCTDQAFPAEVIRRSGYHAIWRGQRTWNGDPANDSAPAWSPDGSRLAFMSDRDMRASADIYTMNAADGSDVQRITRDLANWAPQYAPDGRSLAVQINQDVALIDFATGTIRRLTHAPNDGMNPTWSPDGRRIAFVTTRSGQAEIFVMNADGTEQRPLAAMPNVNLVDPRWSPAGERVVYVALPSANRDQPGASNTQGIHTVEVATGKTSRVSP